MPHYPKEKMREYMRAYRQRARDHPPKLDRQIIDALAHELVSVISADQLRSPTYVVQLKGKTTRERWNAKTEKKKGVPQPRRKPVRSSR
jgi:hypothetical protein